MKWQLFLVSLATQLSLYSGRVQFPQRLFVEPGENFELTCEISGRDVLIQKIYNPKEDLPSGRALEQIGEDTPLADFQAPGAGFDKIEVVGATQEEHQGYYTCVAFRKFGFPRVETATGYVIVIDFCADADCPYWKTCVPDYENFSHTCEGPDFPPTTEAPTDPGGFTLGFFPVCSVYPAGVIKSFASNWAFYDLACTHVLAADFSPSGDFLDPWFVYGTFDQHDGNTAMSHMTVFSGGAAFEFQRGWLINKDGEKFEVQEGVPRALGDCELLFTGRHIKADCPHFSVFYDGVMSGHIQLGDSPVTEVPVKDYSDIGLCWDAQSGFRPNWQVKKEGECTVDTSKEPCEPGEECNSYKDDLAGQGSCSELNCEDDTPTPVQVCSLNQAVAMDKFFRASNGPIPEKQKVDGCPEIACDWQKELLSRGCPQENPPFECD